jgi:hypothetical protein
MNTFDDRTLRATATKMINSQSYSFVNFIEAKETINDEESGLTVVYDRMTLLLYKHNMSHNDFKSFCIFFADAYDARFPRSAYKMRSEYIVLHKFVRSCPEYQEHRITKGEHPDFLLIQSDYHLSDIRIAVEVTELTTQYESVCSAISMLYSPLLRTAEDIHQAARKIHGKKQTIITTVKFKTKGTL